MAEVESLLSVMIFVLGLLAALFIAEYREERREYSARRRRERREELEARQLDYETNRIAKYYGLEKENEKLKHRANQTVTIKGVLKK